MKASGIESASFSVKGRFLNFIPLSLSKALVEKNILWKVRGKKGSRGNFISENIVSTFAFQREVPCNSDQNRP